MHHEQSAIGPWDKQAYSRNFSISSPIKTAKYHHQYNNVIDRYNRSKKSVEYCCHCVANAEWHISCFTIVCAISGNDLNSLHHVNVYITIAITCRTHLTKAESTCMKKKPLPSKQHAMWMNKRKKKCWRSPSACLFGQWPHYYFVYKLFFSLSVNCSNWPNSMRTN